MLSYYGMLRGLSAIPRIQQCESASGVNQTPSTTVQWSLQMHRFCFETLVIFCPHVYMPFDTLLFRNVRNLLPPPSTCRFFYSFRQALPAAAATKTDAVTTGNHIAVAASRCINGRGTLSCPSPSPFPTKNDRRARLGVSVV